MSARTVEWLAVLIFFLFFFALTLAESAWLNKKGGAPVGKAFAFSFATNIFTVVVGFTVSFIVLAALITFTGSGGMGVAQLELGAAIVAGALTLLAVSVLVKRLGLRVFKLDAGASPWLFSIVASITFLVMVIVAPVLFIYFT